MVKGKSSIIAKESIKYDAFWVIYVSCLEKPKSLYEIQNDWSLRGNPLYQKEKKIGMTVSQKMVEECVLEKVGKRFKAVKLPRDFLPKESQIHVDKISKDEEFRKAVLEFVSKNREIFYNAEALFVLFKETPSLIKHHLRVLYFLPEYLAKVILRIKVFENRINISHEKSRNIEDINLDNEHKKIIAGEFGASVKLLDLNIIDYVKVVRRLIRDRKINIPLVNCDDCLTPVGIFDEYDEFCEAFGIEILSGDEFDKALGI